MQIELTAHCLSARWRKCLPPWQIQRVSVRNDFDALAINRNAVVPINLHISTKGAQHGIVLQEVGCLLETTSVIDDNNFQRRVFPPMPAADKIPSNTSKAIDGHLDLCLHNCLLLPWICCLSTAESNSHSALACTRAVLQLEILLQIWCKTWTESEIT